MLGTAPPLTFEASGLEQRIIELTQSHSETSAGVAQAQSQLEEASSVGPTPEAP